MKSSFMLYVDQHTPIQTLSLEQKGKLLDAFFAYNLGEKVVFDDPVLTMAFAFFRQSFDRDTEKYERKCQKNRENVERRYTNSTNVDERNERIPSNTNATDNDPYPYPDPDNDPDILNTPPTPTGGGVCEAAQPDKPAQGKTRFKKPTPDEVSAYCLERKNGIDGQEFCDFYESKGWLIGKNPMKDWQSAVRTWEQRRVKAPSSRASPEPWKSLAQHRLESNAQAVNEFMSGKTGLEGLFDGGSA